ncbi:MAG TPA: Mut7-C RNAse domain-containing protein [Anaerolineae bacterium]|nr:Mut7-C RNAse domain-containing protein [Anaerolineae bacterium]
MRLLADSMLGSLGRWLRLLGYDMAIARSEPDWQLVRQARAEGRVILTRDRELARRQGLQTLLVQDDDLDAQLAQTARDLHLPQPQPGTRCLHCNASLQSASRSDVADDVPLYVLQTQEAFRRCPACRRVYWRGTHWAKIEERIAAIWGATSRSA